LSFLEFFNSGAAALIGMDISTSAIKMVEMSSSSAGRRLEHYVIEALPEGAVVDGEIVNLELVVETVKRAWKRMGTRTRGLAMAIPTASAITRKIIVPAGLSEEELEVRVVAEANQYIPFDLEEVNLDFQVLAPTGPATDELEVLIVAARKEKIEDRVAVAEAAGLKAVVVDVEAHALLAGVALMDVPAVDASLTPCIAVIDIGASQMSLSVVRGDAVLYSREQRFGGMELTLIIMRHYGVSAQEAEAMKRARLRPADYQSAVLENFVSMALMEVQRALQFYQDSSMAHEISQIRLSGGSAVIPGLAEAVAAATGVTTAVANPFSALTIGSAVPRARLAEDAPGLLIACGLATCRGEA
jgi:type IV pilus assembly protein PilM